MMDVKDEKEPEVNVPDLRKEDHTGKVCEVGRGHILIQLDEFPEIKVYCPKKFLENAYDPKLMKKVNASIRNNPYIGTMFSFAMRMGTGDFENQYQVVNSTDGIFYLGHDRAFQEAHQHSQDLRGDVVADLAEEVNTPAQPQQRRGQRPVVLTPKFSLSVTSSVVKGGVSFQIFLLENGTPVSGKVKIFEISNRQFKCEHAIFEEGSTQTKTTSEPQSSVVSLEVPSDGLFVIVRPTDSEEQFVAFGANLVVFKERFSIGKLEAPSKKNLDTANTKSLVANGVEFVIKQLGASLIDHKKVDYLITPSSVLPEKVRLEVFSSLSPSMTVTDVGAGVVPEEGILFDSEIRLTVVNHDNIFNMPVTFDISGAQVSCQQKCLFRAPVPTAQRQIPLFGV